MSECDKFYCGGENISTQNHSGEEFVRTEALLGTEGMERLFNARVAVFGIGGVGSFVVEALARSGVGALDIIDNDKVAPSNLNRQILAVRSTIGRPKVEVMGERIMEINPRARVYAWERFVDKDSMEAFPFEDYDYIVDAIDTVTSKLLLIEKAKAHNIPVISSMGVGNKLHPERLKITDISKTSVCPLARVMRHELKCRHINKVKVLFSDEPPVKLQKDPGNDAHSLNKKRVSPGSIAFVPSVAGLMIAGEVIRDIAGVA